MAKNAPPLPAASPVHPFAAIRKTLSWPRLSSQAQKTNRVPQNGSKLLSLPNELLRMIIEECFAGLLRPVAPPYRFGEWLGLTQSCVILYLITKDMWQYYWHHMPITVDLGKWTWRIANVPPKRHDHLNLYLQLPTFMKLPNEIRMPGTANVRYITIDYHASWIVSAHSDDRFNSMPELPNLKVLRWGPLNYTSPWTMSTLYAQRLPNYRSTITNKGGFRNNANLWARWLPKCPQTIGAYAYRVWDCEEIPGRLSRPMSKKLAPELRAFSRDVVRWKIQWLDECLFELLQNLLKKKTYWLGKWQELVDMEVDEMEPRYLAKLKYLDRLDEERLKKLG